MKDHIGKSNEMVRVKKIAGEWFAAYGMGDERVTKCGISSLTHLILKEIKRAERREREANAKVAEDSWKFNLYRKTRHEHSAIIASAIRNRRKV